MFVKRPLNFLKTLILSNHRWNTWRKPFRHPWDPFETPKRYPRNILIQLSSQGIIDKLIKWFFWKPQQYHLYIYLFISTLWKISQSNIYIVETFLHHKSFKTVWKLSAFHIFIWLSLSLSLWNMHYFTYSFVENIKPFIPHYKRWKIQISLSTLRKISQRAFYIVETIGVSSREIS